MIFWLRCQKEEEEEDESFHEAWAAAYNEVNEYASTGMTIDIPPSYYIIGPPNRRFS